jgi:hypothetical protein
LGVLCGDGYIRIQKSGRGYLVGLDVCDEDFADKFNECLYSTYKLKPSKKLYQPKPTNYCSNPQPRCSISLTSKLVILDLIRYDFFKTKTWIIPKEISYSNDLRIKSAFLRGLFDSEGTIRLRRNGWAYLQFCSGNNDSLLDVKNMLLNDFDIKMKMRHNGSVMILYCQTYNDINNYYEKIGFTIKRKQEKLKFALSTYKRTNLRHYDETFKLQVFSLLEEGYNPYQIGKKLNFPYTNIYDFIKQRDRLEIKQKI